MIYKNFVLQVILRVTLLMASIFAFCYTLLVTDWKITPTIILLVIAFFCYQLVRYINKTNRDLANFLQAIVYHDFSIGFTDDKRGKSYTELKEAFNTVIRSFNNLKADKESHHMYLQNVVEHVGIALLGFNGKGELKMMNNAAKQLLQKAYITHIDALDRIDPKLRQVVKETGHGEQKLVNCKIQQQHVPLSVAVSEFRLQDENVRLVSLQNIQQELDQKEVDAWQKLIRVMTHEIMNSVTPIISLSSALEELLKDNNGNELKDRDINNETLTDLREGLQTIEKRSEGLLSFVQNYRSITKKHDLEKKPIVFQELIGRLVTLLKPELEHYNIQFEAHLPDKKLLLMADHRMIEQLLINLIKNAKEAVLQVPHPKVSLHLEQRGTKTLLRIKDNGTGIDAEIAEHIFVPFFSTKEKGSGIGLSISKQIMQQHDGQIRLLSHQKGQTVIELEF